MEFDFTPQRFDFAGRFQTAFGFVAGNVSARLLESGFGAIEKGNSKLSLEVYSWDDKTTFDEVTLWRDKGGVRESYKFGYSNLINGDVQYFATPPMLSFKRSKKLIISPLSDTNDEEAIERYNTGPYEITWRGLIVDMENHSFPIDKLSLLNDIFEVNTMWNVDSEILHALKVQSIIISDTTIEFIEGFEDTIAYEFSMRATKPLEYQIMNK